MLAKAEFFALTPAWLQYSISSLLSIPSSFANAKILIFKCISPGLAPFQNQPIIQKTFSQIPPI